MLVAADGVGSRVRGLILPHYARPHYTGMLGVGGFVPSDVDLPSDHGAAHRLNFTVGPRLQFGYARLSASSPVWGWWCHLPQETELPRAELQAITDDEFRSRVLQAFRGWPAPVEDFVTATKEIMRTAIYDVPPLPTWHMGRVMLIGDAAHAMSPAGGQGASLALEDAMALGQRLARPASSIQAVFGRSRTVCGPGPSGWSRRHGRTMCGSSRNSAASDGGCAIASFPCSCRSWRVSSSATTWERRRPRRPARVVATDDGSPVSEFSK